MMLGNYHRWNMGTKFSELVGVKVYRPEGVGSRWKGIPHSSMVAALLRCLEDMKCKISGMRFHLSNNDANIAFSCNIIGGSRRKDRTGLSPAFGFTASNSRRGRLTFYCGLSRPEPYRAFVGARWQGSSYTRKFSAVDEMRWAFSRWEDEFDRVNKRLEVYYQRLFNHRSNDALDRVLIKTAERGLLPWSRLHLIVNAMRVKRQTKAKMIFAFSKVVQIKSPTKQMELMYEFLDVLDNYN